MAISGGREQFELNEITPPENSVESAPNQRRLVSGHRQPRHRRQARRPTRYYATGKDDPNDKVPKAPTRLASSPPGSIITVRVPSITSTSWCATAAANSSATICSTAAPPSAAPVKDQPPPHRPRFLRLEIVGPTVVHARPPPHWAFTNYEKHASGKFGNEDLTHLAQDPRPNLDRFAAVKYNLSRDRTR